MDKNQTNYMICKMPPLYFEGKQGEAWTHYITVLNTKMEERYPERIIDLEYTIGDRAQIREDGIHITDLTARRIAEKLAKETKKCSSSRKHKETDSKTSVAKIETNKTKAARVIGAGGERINRMKIKYEVKIQTENVGERQMFIIEGEEQRVEKAKKEIQEIIEETERRNSAQVPITKKHITCRYFIMGECRFGDKCHYLHQANKPRDISPRSSE